MQFSSLLFLAAMAQASNFVDNVLHDGIAQLQPDVIENVAIIADMATSPSFAHRYISANEMDLGAGYSVRMDALAKTLLKNGAPVAANTTTESVMAEISASRGGRQSGGIGSVLSNNYGIHMSGDWAIQMFKRETQPSDSSDSEGTSPNEKRAFRCTNKNVGAPKSCGNNVKSGDPVNSAHNCKSKAGGKGYECTFPQGPNGEDFGICCYSISTAVSCNYEGGYCFLDKVKNTCGTDCLS